MQSAIEILTVSRYRKKVYEKMMGGLCREYRLTVREMDIIMFLANYPGYDTARDIAEIGMFPKSHVSIAIEALCRRGFLEKQPGRKRNVHLRLTKEGQRVVEQGHLVQAEFVRVMFEGLSSEEFLSLMNSQEKISKNLKAAYEGME